VASLPSVKLGVKSLIFRGEDEISGLDIGRTIVRTVDICPELSARGPGKCPYFQLPARRTPWQALCIEQIPNRHGQWKQVFVPRIFSCGPFIEH
jgi:hypothetical protein